jgi:hypothetical protein
LPASLLQSAVCVATQRPEAKGLLWPSKLGLLLALPRPILWIGDPSGAIARHLRGLPEAGVFAPGDAAGVAAWLLAVRARSPQTPPAESPASIRAEALAWWSELVTRQPRA